MNKQELIEEIEDLKDLKKLFGNNPNYIEIDKVIELISKLDEPQPIKLKDVISRIKKLDLGTQKVWLTEILNELGSDYGVLKYKAGYEQGKVEGEWVGQQLKDADKIRQELNKPVVPQIVADYIKETKEADWDLMEAMDGVAYEDNKDLRKWFNDNIETFARAWLDGYEVEKEKRYLVNVKNVRTRQGTLNRSKRSGAFIFSNPEENNLYGTKFTRTELEQAGFGWVFDCPGIEIEEVEG